MKSLALPSSLVALLFASCAGAPNRAQEMTTADRSNRVSLYFGGRQLDDDDYEPVDEQFTYGIEYVREPAGSVIGFEVGAMGSESREHESGFDVKGRTGEIYAGLHKTLGHDVIRGQFGAGVSYIQSKIDIEGIGDDDDTSFAGYVHGGITADLGTTAYIGLDLRFLFASDMTLGGANTDANYGQLALMLGFAF
jgi:hypothetical protein